MIGKKVKVLLAAVLCMAMMVNTTAGNTAEAAAAAEVAEAAGASGTPGIAKTFNTAQNDIALPLPGSIAPSMREIRIALLLPLRSPTLSSAAEAVRAGFEAAYAYERNGVSVTTIDTDGTAQGALTAYTDAIAQYDMIVGPLSRSEVAAVAQSGMVDKPTIALAQPEQSGDAEPVLPSHMLAAGLSVEEEARHAAQWIGATKAVSKVFVISTPIAWQRRAAKAFTAQWRASGLLAQTMELRVTDGYLNANSLVQLKKQLQEDRPDALFVALNAGQTGQLRLAIGSDIPVYGTSQLNPFVLSGEELPEKSRDVSHDLDGVYLFDMPWQLQLDHPAVMAYSRPVPNVEQQRNADLERLYALGIDAYRIAHAIAAGKRNFILDGVSGRLHVQINAGASRFERIMQPAVYEDGKVVPSQGVITLY